MEDFKDLRVWEKAHELTLDVYKTAARLSERRNVWINQSASPSYDFDRREHRRGMWSQVRSRDDGAFCKSLAGSANEVEYHLLLARDLQLLEVR